MSEESPVIIDAATGEIETLPPTKNRRYRCKLDTLADVKAEMAKVYREARSEQLDPAAATKLVWMLQAVGKVIETGDIEKRIEQLENSLGKK